MGVCCFMLPVCGLIKAQPFFGTCLLNTASTHWLEQNLWPQFARMELIANALGENVSVLSMRPLQETTDSVCSKCDHVCERACFHAVHGLDYTVRMCSFAPAGKYTVYAYCSMQVCHSKHMRTQVRALCGGSRACPECMRVRVCPCDKQTFAISPCVESIRVDEHGQAFRFLPSTAPFQITAQLASTGCNLIATLHPSHLLLA